MFLVLKGRVNSLCSNPFFSNNATTCLFGNFLVEAMRFPDGFQNKFFSKPSTSSLVYCKIPSRSKTLNRRAPNSLSMKPTANIVPSPLQLITGIPSSVLVLPTIVSFAFAAALPSEPWNCVSFFPQPTVMNCFSPKLADSMLVWKLRKIAKSMV